jgi:hypothetical protein
MSLFKEDTTTTRIEPRSIDWVFVNFKMAADFAGASELLTYQEIAPIAPDRG